MTSRKVSKKTNVNKQELLSFYKDMLLIRRFEEKAGQLYGMGLIGGFCHLYIGQEAVVVGLEASAEEGDKRITSYRDHGHMLACGMDPNGVMAELTGRSGGYSKGKGGSMHMFSKEKGGSIGPRATGAPCQPWEKHSCAACVAQRTAPNGANAEIQSAVTRGRTSRTTRSTHVAKTSVPEKGATVGDQVLRDQVVLHHRSGSAPVATATGPNTLPVATTTGP